LLICRCSEGEGSSPTRGWHIRAVETTT